MARLAHPDDRRGNVALPTIDRDLHASAGMLQLVVAGYAVSYALLLVVGGRIGAGGARAWS